MKTMGTIGISMLVLSTALCCCCAFPFPQVELPEVTLPTISVPTIEVGDLQEETVSLPLTDTDAVTVQLSFGAGELAVESGPADQLVEAQFRYNVAEWKPEVTYEDHRLTIEQDEIRNSWGIPSDEVRNEWKLEFSPDVPLDMTIQAGAGNGELDFGGLQITDLRMDLGAGDFDIRFNTPSETTMERLTMNAGAAKLSVVELGNAGLKEMTVQGGVGDILLDFTGDWSHSAEVEIIGGVGSFTIQVPDDVGVHVTVEGISNLDVSGLRRQDDAYVNDAFGETEIELRIRITTGLGDVHIIEVSNEGE